MKHENIIIYIMMLGTFGVLSTEMGVVGILPQISQYFNVDITQAGLFVSLFALTIAICGIFMPLVFSKFDRKKKLHTSSNSVHNFFNNQRIRNRFQHSTNMQNNTSNISPNILWSSINCSSRNC
ncbi:hypothetical protein PXD04_11215 (plasmid) [Methanosphaera sp. ISO3-F5]|uniref:hypothetical protein n=1 Tax=Methanosphaera sp. ISO3-F5 TaxID=1452353 RepID=UPI002B2612D0|nr:hypothetical protein [Methanosphaera sp. ISO3-F5]WQH65444.1 hypothetical protein PXD04_11215 [Methanosphaera sp. ISO3-F5]